MSLLLDTHVVLWWLTDDPTLPEDVKSRLELDPDVYVSAASLWEIGIKKAIGKLKEPEDIVERVGRLGFRDLPIAGAHAIAAARLPLIHRDPFDRMLVGQATCEHMTLMTRDADIQKYDVRILAV